MSWNDLRKGRVSDPGSEYFITFVCHNRCRIFNNHLAAKTFCQQIAINQQRYNCLWKTWVLMPDHFHGLLQLGDEDLGRTIAHLKGITARRVNEVLSTTGSVWQSSYYDHGLRAEEDRKGIARYIISNPLRAGLAKSVKEYAYWDSVYL